MASRDNSLIAKLKRLGLSNDEAQAIISGFGVRANTDEKPAEKGKREPKREPTADELAKVELVLQTMLSTPGVVVDEEKARAMVHRMLKIPMPLPAPFPPGTKHLEVYTRFLETGLDKDAAVKLTRMALGPVKRDRKNASNPLEKLHSHHHPVSVPSKGGSVVAVSGADALATINQVVGGLPKGSPVLGFVGVAWGGNARANESLDIEHDLMPDGTPREVVRAQKRAQKALKPRANSHGREELIHNLTPAQLQILKDAGVKVEQPRPNLFGKSKPKTSEGQQYEAEARRLIEEARSIVHDLGARDAIAVYRVKELEDKVSYLQGRLAGLNPSDQYHRALMLNTEVKGVAAKAPRSNTLDKGAKEAKQVATELDTYIEYLKQSGASASEIKRVQTLRTSVLHGAGDILRDRMKRHEERKKRMSGDMAEMSTELSHRSKRPNAKPQATRPNHHLHTAADKSRYVKGVIEWLQASGAPDAAAHIDLLKSAMSSPEVAYDLAEHIVTEMGADPASIQPRANRKRVSYHD